MMGLMFYRQVIHMVLELMSYLSWKEGGSSFFYHTDGLGSIVDLTDNLGAIVQSYVYDSFGNIVLQNGSLVNPYTYTGRKFDSESGLYFYRSRYYDPRIGRFLREDLFPSLTPFCYHYSITKSRSTFGG